MINGLHVTGFKAVKDSGVVQLGQLEVLIGRNGTGKSSLIEALEVVADGVRHGRLDIYERFRRARDVIAVGAESASVALTFDPKDVSVGDSVEYSIELRAGDADTLSIEAEQLEETSGTESQAIITTTGGVRHILYPEGWIETELKRRGARGVKVEQLTAELRVQDSAQLALPFLAQGFGRGAHLLKEYLHEMQILRLSPSAIAAFTPRERPSHHGGQLDCSGLGTAALLSTLDEDAVQALVEKLSLALPQARKLDLHEPDGPADRGYFGLEHAIDETPVLVPAWVLSEGVRRLTTVLAVLLQPSPPSLLVVEEVENGFDPWTLRFVLEELLGASEAGCQVILTTHSPYLMNLLPPEVFMYVERSAAGAEFSRLDGETAHKIAESMGVGDAYVGRTFSPRKGRGPE